MTALVWDQIDERRYESGVDRGVLYPEAAVGVVWNGLLSVQEAFVGGDRESLYFDGVKYFDYVSGKFYKASVEAFSSPPEFASCLGLKSPRAGFYLTNQPRERFGFSYRTQISDEGYKVHLVYNVLATPVKKSHSTISATPSPNTLAWQFDAVPPESNSYRPSAHFILDSTVVHPSRLELLETTLYGTNDVDPMLPSQMDLIGLIRDDVISEPLTDPM